MGKTVSLNILYFLGLFCCFRHINGCLPLNELRNTLLLNWQSEDMQKLRNETVDKIWNITMEHNILNREKWNSLLRTTLSRAGRQLSERISFLLKDNCCTDKLPEELNTAVFNFLVEIWRRDIVMLMEETITNIWEITTRENVFNELTLKNSTTAKILEFQQRYVIAVSVFVDQNCGNPTVCSLQPVSGNSDAMYYDRNMRKCVVRPEILVDYDDIMKNNYSCAQNTFLFKYGNYGVCVCNFTLMRSHDRDICIQGKLHGEHCDNGPNACDKYTGLKCSNQKCICTGNWFDFLCHSDEACRARNQIFNPIIGRCQLRLHSPCHEASSSCPQSTVCGVHEKFPWPVCRCSPNLNENILTGRCTPNFMYGQKCKINANECSQTAMLHCVNGYCACPVEAKWEERENRCRQTKGTVCGINRNISAVYEQCGRNGECKKGVCACKEGFLSDGTGFCVAKYLTECSKTGDCQLGLICYDEVCKCPKISSQTYEYGADDLEKSCLGKLGSSCSSTSKCSSDFACIENICQCAPGTTLSNGGKCMKTFEQTCTVGKCNHDEGLACVEGNCKCADSDLTFLAGKGCLAKFGHICGKIDTVGLCPPLLRFGCGRESYKIGCEFPAKCEQLSGSLSICKLP